MILNKEEVEKALNNQEIEIIKYTWENFKTGETPSKPIGVAFAEEDLKHGYKIRLHVGFLLRTLSDKKWLDPSILYNKRDGIVDLRNHDRKYKLLPGESVLIYTNEFVKFNGDYFGLLLPRVSLEEIGLVVSPSYVDPNWSGVLQVVVTNNSEVPQFLQVDCEIINLVIFKMQGNENDLPRNHNGHYGLDWQQISQDPNRFPAWKNRQRNRKIRILHFIRTNWVLFCGIGFVGIITFLYYIIDIIISIIDILGRLNLL